MNEQSSTRELVFREPREGRLLSRLAELAKELGANRIGEEADSLAERVSQGRFYVACVGQFKRGKSTLLNALLDEAVLPAGVLPVTAVPTVVRYGGSKSARIRFENGSWSDVALEDLVQYVSEESNPENRKGVAAAEVFCPSPLLIDGMCLVDTPGLGSVFLGNSAATQTFVPHIDAAIVVVGTDPPITADELKLVEEVGKQVRDLVVVLNKADRNTDSDREIARIFTAGVLEKRLGRAVNTVYEISGKERLEGCGSERDWPKLIAALYALSRDSGASMVRQAAERAVRRFSEELLVIISEEQDALFRPVEESERRIAKLRETIQEANRSLQEISYLFLAEEHRLSDMLLKRRKQFLSDTLTKAADEFQETLKYSTRLKGPHFRREAFRVAQSVAEKAIVPWLGTEQQRAATDYRRVEERFVEIGNEFLHKLSDAGVRELAGLPHALDSGRGFRVRSEFTFQGLIHVAEPASPLRFCADVFLGAIGLSSKIERDAREFLDHLMEMNSARVQSDVVRRVEESRVQLEAEIRKLLHEVGRIAESALDHARAVKEQGGPATAAALARLDRIKGELLDLLSA